MNPTPDHPLFPDPALARRLLEEATRPDRRYPLRSNKYYGFHAGRLPGGHQAVVTGGTHGFALCIHRFDTEGNFLQVDRRNVDFTPPRQVPFVDVDDAPLLQYLAAELGFEEDLLRIKCLPDAADAEFDIQPFPSHFLDFLEGQGTWTEEERASYPQRILTWVRNGEFVLNYGNDYWLDANGEVTSS